MSNLTNKTPKKQKILDAAFETIYEKTIGSTNVREIARKAEMSPGNLHYYYPAKDKILIDLLDFLLGNFINKRKQLVDNSEASAQEKLFNLLDYENSHVLKRKEMCVFMDFCINGSRNEDIQQKVQETYQAWLNLINSIIDEGIFEGAFSDRFRNIIPDLLISIIDGAALRYHVNEKSFNPKQYFESVKEVLAELLRKP
jgi:TetR/AcrR family transcriptional regulator